MNTSRKNIRLTITYYYRGLVERGGPSTGYRWAQGYSAEGPNGEVLYPWQTRRECQAEAKAENRRAVFVDERRVG